VVNTPAAVANVASVVGVKAVADSAIYEGLEVAVARPQLGLRSR
jgi:hypothetical protein